MVANELNKGGIDQVCTCEKGTRATQPCSEPHGLDIALQATLVLTSVPWHSALQRFIVQCCALFFVAVELKRPESNLFNQVFDLHWRKRRITNVHKVKPFCLKSDRASTS